MNDIDLVNLQSKVDLACDNIKACIPDVLILARAEMTAPIYAGTEVTAQAAYAGLNNGVHAAGEVAAKALLRGMITQLCALVGMSVAP